MVRLKIGDIVRWKNIPELPPIFIISIEPVTDIATVESKFTGIRSRYFLSTLEDTCMKINHYSSKLGRILYK